MTSPRPLVPVKDALVERRAALTCALLKEIMAADIAFSDSAATSVAAAFGAFADDAGSPGRNRHSCLASAIELYDPLRQMVPAGARGRRGGAQGDFSRWLSGACRRSERTSANPATAGHYFTIWRRDANGRWRCRLTRDAESSDALRSGMKRSASWAESPRLQRSSITPFDRRILAARLAASTRPL
jgi:hypothetical protein